MSAIERFHIRAPDSQLEDLRRRLGATRWPDRETVDDWSQGIPLAYVQEVAAYWKDEYDWRSREALINEFPQYITRLDDLDIHFIHVRSPQPDATPLLMTHGWPGSIVEFLKVIRPLSDPQAHGGRAADAFHVVCPALPGFGFSAKPTRTGCGTARIAELWDDLMLRLGYPAYVAQGGDWGAAVTTAIAMQDRGHCTAIHLNVPLVRPPPGTSQDPSEAERRALAVTRHYEVAESGYARQQSTRPQTLGYGLIDSPVAQAAWILEKFWAWTDCDGHPENVLSRDELLDNVMLYWLPATGTSSARLYWESFGKSFSDERTVSLPTDRKSVV